METRINLRDMARLILLNLLFSACGLGGSILYVYRVVNENKTWNEAQTYCRLKYTDLLTIKNMEEMNNLSVILTNQTAIPLWIGLRRINTWTMKWSLANEALYKDGRNYTKWRATQPDNWLGMEYCTHMHQSNGLWNDCYCNSLYCFVCYSEKNTNTNRYIFVNETKTWYDARTFCREKYTDLASSRNQSENDEIQTVIPSSQYVWIGLYNDSWTWSDKSNALFTYWSWYNVNGDVNCAVVNMSKSKYWNTVNCTERLPFICYENVLILINQNLSWWEALNYCRDHHHDLFSVRTEEMQIWVKKLALKALTENVWLGLRHDCAQRIWFWVSGSMLCYQNWAPGNGTWNEDCSQDRRSGAVQSGGNQQWIELPESNKLNFICSLKDDLYY